MANWGRWGWLHYSTCITTYWFMESFFTWKNCEISKNTNRDAQTNCIESNKSNKIMDCTCTKAFEYNYHGFWILYFFSNNRMCIYTWNWLDKENQRNITYAHGIQVDVYHSHLRGFDSTDSFPYSLLIRLKYSKDCKPLGDFCNLFHDHMTITKFTQGITVGA